jgi:hypothetical protein
MKRDGTTRVIHSFDTERHRVLCGILEQTSSTKHASAVTCSTCRELLGRGPVAAGPAVAAAPEE